MPAGREAPIQKAMPTQLSDTDFGIYFENHLYEQNFFENELPGQFPPPEQAQALMERIKSLSTRFDLSQLNEAQLEHDYLAPVLESLGWTCLPQVQSAIQGKEIKPDWCLFSDSTAKEHFLARLAQKGLVFPAGSVLCEAKAAGKPLDTKKAAKKDNPYIQLLEYLTYARLPHGFLTNGLEWWLVDNSVISSGKRYLRVNLGQILQGGNLAAFQYFHFLFRKATYAQEEDEKETGIAALNRQEAAARVRVESDLRSVIYGTDGRDSLFERLGQAIFKASLLKPTPDNLREIFENSLYLVFRLLFIAYFEDKYRDQLSTHPYYNGLSLRQIHGGLSEARSEYSGWRSLRTLFNTLSGGNAAMGIPLLNGGLFEDNKASLLSGYQVIDNRTLKLILDELLFYQRGLFRRDFRSLSVTHLGTIYEGLLEFEFRLADEALSYLEYKDGKVQQSGYFDSYDAETIRHNPACYISVEREYRAGQLYLVGSHNSRKSTGSYYTPSSLSLPLIRRAIDHQLGKIGSVVELRILDNACGSGHLLIEALNYLTRKALSFLESDALLASQLVEEKAKIECTFNTFSQVLGGFSLEVDEFAVLKRILLKQVIYGVDMQPFAVELAHLALWIDTFVFGTPLSFIEHHVKVGNSLIGTTMERFKEFVTPKGQFTLLQEDLNKRFNTLHGVLKKLNSIRDTTPEEVKRSADVYRTEIRPALDELDRALDVVNYYDMLLCEGRKKEAHALKNTKQLGPTLLKGKDNALAVKIADYKDRYRFFNWEVEFPEAFAGKGDMGFHVIVGNPPWDNINFEEPLFFSQYRSNYRTLSYDEKKNIRFDLLDNQNIKQKYETEKQHIHATSKYLKDHFPYNSSSGNNNIFRFFVEQNIKLLSKSGTLNYVLPTGILTDDGSIALRKHIFANYTINHFDGFENKLGIFQDVDSRYKFGLLQIENKRDIQQKALVRFMLTDPSILDTDKGIFEYGYDDIVSTSPDYFAYLEISGGRADLDILSRAYKLFSPINEDWLDFRVELNSTTDRDLFVTEKPANHVPLFKWAMIWQYNSSYDTNEYWMDTQRFDNHLINKEISRFIKDIHPYISNLNSTSHIDNVLKLLNLKNREDLIQFVVPDRHFFRLGYRDIARDTDERTLISSLLPNNIGAQDTLWLSIPKRYFIGPDKLITTKETPSSRLLFTQALFNSIPVDWIVRFSAAIHVTKSLLMRLPLPQPGDSELAENAVYSEMVLNSLKLSLHFNLSAFEELRQRFNIPLEAIPKTEKQVDRLKIRNDCLVAGLYAISPDELTHMLASFKVLNKKRPQYVAALKEFYARYHQDLAAHQS